MAARFNPLATEVSLIYLGLPKVLSAAYECQEDLMRITADRTDTAHGLLRKRTPSATWQLHIKLENDTEERDVEVHLDHVTKDVEKVVLNGSPIGFVHHVEPVYVALTGPDLDRAVEVSQKLTLNGSIKALLDTVPIEKLTAN